MPYRKFIASAASEYLNAYSNDEIYLYELSTKFEVVIVSFSRNLRVGVPQILRRTRIYRFSL